MHSIAKFWIEKEGKPCVEIAYSTLSKQDNEMIASAIETEEILADIEE